MKKTIETFTHVETKETVNVTTDGGRYIIIRNGDVVRSFKNYGTVLNWLDLNGFCSSLKKISYI